ncbi:MAG: methionine--tRNA ligase [Armatimonadota bacterium]|nr:methionine--tRNA ligase [bacterium]
MANAGHLHILIQRLSDSVFHDEVKVLMPKDTYYITTPIYYVNDVPHVGNAYTTIIADTVSRYHKLKCEKTYLLTGTDEHAVKVAAAAADKGIPTKDFVDHLAEQFKRVWASLDVHYDDFIRTTEPRHIQVVQAIFARLFEQGDIYKGEYQGWYCIPDETFLAESELVDGKCPECGRQVEWVQEENYYFKLSAYSDRLLEYIESHPGFLQPEFRKNEVVSFIKQGLRDVSITRDNKGWGITVPGDDSKVIYVWFDALINYISAIGYLSDEERFNSLWPADLQLMGKDIFVRFHCTFWPAMLMALGLEQPKVLFGHGWWSINGEKISKSRGNAISPAKLAEDLAEESGASRDVCLDAVRYFLAREVTFGVDGDFSIASFKNRFNSDLANDLGNLLNRTLSMLNKYFDGIIPGPKGLSGGLAQVIAGSAKTAQETCDKLEFTKALEAVWQMIGAGNKYVNDQKPWELEKQGKTDELAGVLYSALEVARAAAIMISPFMPATAVEIARQLGIADSFAGLKWSDITAANPFVPGTKTQGPDPIFPRLGTKKKEAKVVEEPKPAEAPQPEKTEEYISYDYFSKLKIRIAEIKSAERVEKADKLLRLQVSLGDEERQIVAGIAKSYEPEALIGRKIVMLTNLEPAKIRGVVSNGMLLAADGADGGAVLLQPEADVPAGTKIK